MIKIKCRGREGDLRRLEADVTACKALFGETARLATYDILMDISEDESVEFRNVKPCEIEYIS